MPGPDQHGPDPASRPLDHLTLRGDPTATALIDRDGALTFASLEAAVGALAAALAARGLEPGARVASWLPKTRMASMLPLACARAGLVHVPINPLLKRLQVAHILGDSAADLLITADARIDGLEAGDVPAYCIALGDEAGRTMLGYGEHMGPSQAASGDLAALLYTSGSTGRPKGVMLSHANLWLGAISVAHYTRLTPDDRVLAVLPYSFDYGQNQLLSAWAAGACVVPLDFLTPKDVIRVVDEQRITTIAGVPPLWVQLIEAAWPPATALNLRRLTNSGGKLPTSVIRRMRELFPVADIYSMYGLTEAFRSTYLEPALLDSHPDSMGTAIPFAEIMVVRPDGSATKNGEEGELVHAGPLVAQGYWRDPARTAERFRPAPGGSTYGGMSVWSGDTVKRDADGLLYFVGREDGMIKSAGNRISPTEIEDAAIASGLVAEAVALGTPDPQLGAAIVLIARPSGKADEPALRTSLKRSLPNFMQPKFVLWRAELPRSPNGKIDRNLLAQELTA